MFEATQPVAGVSLDLLSSGLIKLLRLQREIQRSLASEFMATRDSTGLLLPTLLMAMAFAFGAVHAGTPGHGKSIVVSYFLGQGGVARRGVAMSAKVIVTDVSRPGVSQFTGKGRPHTYTESVMIVEVGSWRAQTFFADLDGAGALASCSFHGFFRASGRRKRKPVFVRSSCRMGARGGPGRESQLSSSRELGLLLYPDPTGDSKRS